MTTAPKSAHDNPAPPVKSWQWDGSTDHTTWPDWVAKHNVTADAHGLKIPTSGGILSAVKGEWICENDKGQLGVTKQAPAKR